MCASLFCPSITRQRLIFVSLKRSTYECVCDMQIKYVWRGPIHGLCHNAPREQILEQKSWNQLFLVTKDANRNTALHACMLEPSRSFIDIPFVHPCTSWCRNVCKLRSGRYNCYQCLVFESTASVPKNWLIQSSTYRQESCLFNNFKGQRKEFNETWYFSKNGYVYAYSNVINEKQRRFQ